MAAEKRYLLGTDELWKLLQEIQHGAGGTHSGGRAYDYVRWSWCDVNGIARGFTIPAEHAKEFVQTGYSAFAGSILFSHVSEVNEKLFENILKKHGVENCNFVPAIPRVYALRWVDQRNLTAEVICEGFWEDGSPFAVLPRYVARQQIDKLRKMGYRLSCAFESEFTVLNAETLQPDFTGRDYASHARVTANAGWLYEVDKQLRQNGIDVRSFHAEYGPSQFEFTFMPKNAMETVDNMYMYTQAIKDIARKHGKLVSFMTKIFEDGASNSSHFNHSLWDMSDKNVFWDTTKPDNLSDIGRYWIGGTLKHLTALTALCCPTINCYRRLHNPIVPYRPNWAIDDRHMALRVVNKSEQSMRVENRLPSSASNLYLVTAAVVAAGIDGISNNIEPPLVGLNPEAEDLPHSLADALEALQADDVICEALGEEFVTTFVELKRGFEVKAFGNHDMKTFIAEEVAAERAKYLERFQPDTPNKVHFD